MGWWIVILGGVALYFLSKYKFEKVPADAVKVESRSSGRVYYVSPKEQSCSCPDWHKRRSNVPKDDPRRLCKHLISYYIGQDQLPESLSLFKGGLDWFYEKFRGFPPSAEIERFDVGKGEVAFFKDYEAGHWHSVCFNGKRYGWERASDTWTNDTCPEVRNMMIRHQLGVPDDLAEDAIRHVSAERDGKPLDWVIIGQIEGEEIKAKISLRKNAVWHTVLFNGKEISFYLKAGHSKGGGFSDEQYTHMNPPVSKWIGAECKRLRAGIDNK
ncbi:hypothetical protein [Maridesulfovibrio ferrireducens]|uniref:hypothetical protein n=1 Tax=Maridesulfovibrio ferrireducens TaxID=246191 RepID=UPI001A1B5FFC|nr:hypothetical protein [Maridesulfovibrio ferrireducens]MBI9109987.1 hypothetical protein [Maridesulfovibrio ferrireducens]